MTTAKTKRVSTLLSRALRQNMTEAEIKLWSKIRAHQLDDVHFRRQFPVGDYVVDFCAPRKKLIIEVDGSQHIDQHEYDTERSAYLESLGYTVLRFWNHEVLNDTDAVLLAIYQQLQQ